MYAAVKTVSEQVLWREHAALAQKLSKKISTRHGAADKRRPCAIAGGMVAISEPSSLDYMRIRGRYTFDHL